VEQQGDFSGLGNRFVVISRQWVDLRSILCTRFRLLAGIQEFRQYVWVLQAFFSSTAEFDFSLEPQLTFALRFDELLQLIDRNIDPQRRPDI
jgi:hypothetical protein